MLPRDRGLPMTARGNQGDFSLLDAYIDAANAEALAALAARIDVEGRLVQLFRDAEHLPQNDQELDHDDS
jgi:hypothetical protein